MLDLGSGSGSFDAASCPAAFVVRVDHDPKTSLERDRSVLADAARLPFPDQAFDFVVANHCLEHVEGLDAVLREIGRVVRRDGSLSSTLTDRIYRWVYHGGCITAGTRQPDSLRRELRLRHCTGYVPEARRHPCPVRIALLPEQALFRSPPSAKAVAVR